MTAATATTYAQAFTRADGAVNETYTLAGPRLAQDATNATAAMNSRGSSVVFSPAGVLNSTGALIDNQVTAACAGGNGTATDCGTSGTVTITFSRPVTNPTLNLSGLGGSETLANGSFANFATYANLTASASSTTAANSATLGPLLGTPTNLQLVGGRLQTTGLRPSTSCDTLGTTGATSTAGCGSVQVTGTNLTSITLTLGVRNSGSAIDPTATQNTIEDAFLLTTSIPDVVPPLTKFACSNNGIYGVDGTDYNVNKIDTNTGAETFIGHINAATGTNLNGLSIVNGGAAAYAINRNVTTGGATTIYRLDPTTNTSTSYAGPTVALATGANTANIVEGAVDPASGIYYFAYIDAGGLEIYGFNTATNTPITGRIAHLSGVTGGNGDFSFDRTGKLVLTASSGDGTNSANPLIYITQALPTTGTDAALTGKTISYLTPNDSTFNGLAFDLPQGYLYVNSSTGGQSTIRQLNPTSGVEVANHGITYQGQATNDVVDLASCNYNNSIQVQKNIVSRTNTGDQFTVTLTGGGLATPLTGTTSGTAVGLQTNSTATAGPAPVLAGTNFTFTETAGNAGTNLASYATTWTCTNTFTGATLFSGTGTTGTITFPTPTDNNGIPLNCVFRNESINSSIAITKTADKTAYRAGQTVTYTIKVTNTGNSTLSNVTVTDPSNTSCAKTYATLAAGASQTYTCTATAPVPNNSNTANVSGTDPVNKTVTATSTVPVPVINPALTLTKTASPTVVTTLGQQVTYTFSVKNTGDTAISALSIADSPVAPGGVPATISCQATTLAVGATTTCTGTYAATQADLNNGKIVDNAVANGTDPVGGAVASNTATATVNVTQAPKLTLTKTATPTTVASVGSTVSYAFTVTNTGNVTVTGVAVGDVFDNASVTPPTITCPSTTLLPGASERCTASYVATQSDFDQGSINNTATATAKDPNNATVTSPTSSASVTASAAASLSLVKTATPTTITAAGQTVTYAFKVTNTGNQTLNSVAINDTFTAPAGPALNPITCGTTTLAPAATTNCTATYVATQADVNNGSILNSATATAKNLKGTAVTSAQSNATVTVTQAPALTLRKTAAPTTITAAGQQVTYTFAVTNSGNTTISNIAIADTLASPAGPALGPITCGVTSLLPAGTTNCTATYTATQADVNNGTIKNTATVSGTDPNNAPVTSPVASATVNVTRTATLQLTKSASPTSVSTVGQTVTYSFKVLNTGNQTITGVSINDTLTTPANPPLTITCDRTSIDPGVTANCTATYKATQADLDNGTINNSATATGKDQTGTTVTSNTSTATVLASTAAALTLLKTANPTTVTAAGQTVNYSFKVTNSGTTTITGVAITDPMFTGVNAASCPTTTLAPGASVTCTASYKATQADVDKGSIVNTATAAGKDPKNATVTSPSSTATVTATQTSTLSLVKSATPGSVKNAGDTITYSFLVTNTGNTTITALAITDTFTAPASPVPAITCAATTLVPNQQTTCTSAAYTVTQADVNAGAVNNSATAGGKSPSGTTVTSNTSTASVPASATTKLTLLKSVNPPTITSAGQNVTYTFTVTNASNVTVTGLTIADAFTAPGGPLVNAISCNATTLAPSAGTTCSVVYTATQADVDAGSIKNSATATAKDPSGNTVTSNSSTANVTIPPASSLSITKSADPTTVTAAGQTVAYTFIVTNTGNTTLTAAGVTDTFTAPAGPAITPNCPATAILPTKSITCTASYTVTQADVNNGSIKNSASASAKDPSGASVVSPTANATVTVTRTNGLTVKKAASPTSVTAAGQQISYTFTVGNTGNTTLSLLTIVDTLTAPASPTPTVTCPSTTIAPNSNVICTASYTVTQADIDSGSISNSAVAKATDPTGATITSPPSTATVSVASAASLQLTKAASPTTVSAVGQTVTYVFTVKNTGSATVKNIAISDTFTAPAGPALAPITCNSTSLAPGISTTCSASYTVTQADLDAGTINNAATAAGTNPAGGAVTSNTSTATVTTTAAPSLSLTKAANPTSVTAAGQTVTYTFTVKNTGNVAISGVAIADSRLATAPTCTPGTIAPNAVSTCSGVYTATQADVNAGSFTNTATASGKAPGGATVTSPTASATVTATATPALTITKSASPTTVPAGTALGSTVTYTFVVKNTGNVTVTGVNVVDRFTAPAGPPLAPITCGATSLLPGAFTTCTAAYSVTQADIDKGTIVNSATAAGLDPSNAAVGSAPATATVTITQTSTLRLVKSANPTTATKAGQSVTYTFAVTNTGNTTLTGLAITDTFAAPAGPALQPINCVATTLAPGASTTCSAAYTITQADVDNGSINNTATAGATNPAGTKITSNVGSAAVTIGAGPALSLTKTAGPATYSAIAQTITYTFTVTNTGTVTVGNIAITDPMFTGNAAPTCLATSLAPNASTTCTATYQTTQVDLDNGKIVNTATAAGTTPGGAPVTSPSASATVTATQSPALKLQKSASPQTVVAIGDPVSYTFRVTNTGNVSVSGINVTDVFVAPASDAMAVDCPDDRLAPGQFEICTLSYPSTAADFAAGQINNTATAHAVSPTNTPVDSNPSSAVVTTDQAPGLRVVKSASPASLSSVGQTVTYSFAVTNNGTVPLTNVAVVDTFAAPAGPEITPTCLATTLNAGDSTTCTATYAATQADIDNGSINNSAVATGAPPTGPAITSPPSTATVDTTASAALTLTKSASPTTVTAVGQTVTYTFRVTNSGATTVTGVGIADPMFTGANVPVCSGGTGANGLTLAPGKSLTCTAAYQATQADLDRGSILNTATATGRDPQNTAVSSNAASATVTARQAPALTVLKTAKTTGPIAKIGDPVTFTVLVTNTGNVTLSNVTVADSLTAPASPALTLACPSSTTVAPTKTITCTATYAATQADLDNGTISNTATATGTTQPGTSGTGTTVTSDPSTVTVPTAAASSLSLVKTVSVPTAVVGQQVTYRFAVTNTGSTTINGITINDTFTAPATPVPTVRCPVTTLAPGGTTTCTGNYTIKQADADKGRVDNSATVSGTDATGKAVVSAPSTASLTIPQTSSLSLVKAADPTAVSAVGQTVSYTFTVTNTGTTTISGVAIKDTFTGASTPPLTVSCPTAPLAPATATVCTATYSVTQADLDNGSIPNSATASGTNPAGTTVTSQQSTALVAVTQSSALSLVKSASPTSITAAGQTINYAFVVTNNGSVTLSNVAIADALQPPAGALATGPTCPTTTVLPDKSVTCTGTYISTQADVDNGSIKNTATASATDPQNRSVTSDPASATVNVVRSSALTLTKAAAPTTVTAANQKVTYTFIVTNKGNVTLTGLAIADTFTAPAGPPLSSIACLATTLAPNASTSCTASYTTTQNDVDAGSIANSATASAKDPSGLAVNSNASTALVGVTQTQTLSLVKSVSPTTATAAGQVVKYSFQVTNNGNVTVSGLAIADTFTAPAGPLLNISCTSTVVAPGKTVVCTANYTVTQLDVNQGSILNSATASGTNPAGAKVTSPESSATVTIPKTSALTVVKSADVSTVSTAGRSVTYSFKVTNSGNQTVRGIDITDTFTAPAGPATPASCPVTTLQPGESTTCTAPYTVTPADIDNGSIKNSAVATGIDPSGATITSPPSTYTITALQSSGLQLLKTATVTDVDQDGKTDLGDTIAYTFAVTNTGNRTLSALSVTDPTAGNVTCLVTTLAAGASTTCTADVPHKITQADVDNGTVDNTATASAKDSAGNTVPSAPSSAVVPVASASSLTLVKSAAPTTVTAAGQTVTYSFLVTNTGSTTITKLTVADTQAAPAGALTTGPTCPAAALLPGRTATCTATYVVTQADIDNGSVTNSATVTGSDPAGNPVTTPASAATVQVNSAPALKLVKTASPTTLTAAGQTVTYTFTVTNTGNVTATGLAITDTFTAPGGPAPAPTCVATTLLPGATTSCTTSYVATQPDVDAGTIKNTATAGATGPGGAPIVSAPSSATVTITPAPALSLVKSASPATVSTVGQTVTYSFLVTNTGNVTISGIAIADTFTAPAGPPLGTINCLDTVLAPTDTTTCTATYAVTQNDLDHGVIDNRATVSGNTPAGVTVTSPVSRATVPATDNPTLTLVKSASPTTITAAGQIVNYTFTITNTGNVTVNNLAITDTFTAPAGPALSINCPKTPLVPGGQAVCTAAYTATQADVDNGSIKNSATAGGTDSSGKAAASLPSTATVSVAQAPGLTVKKSASPTAVTKVGDAVLYTFLVTNTGNVTVTGISVADTFSAPAAPVPAISCAASSLVPGGTTTCSGTYLTTQADLDNGSITNSATVSGSVPGGGTTTSPASTATVTVTPNGGLTVTKTATPKTVSAVGDTITYSFLVTNTSNVTVGNVGVTDTFSAPAGVTVGVSCPVTTLAPAASTTCTGTYTATQADIDRGTLTNSAIATGSTPGGGTVTSPPATLTVTAPAAPSLTVQKSATPATISAVGDTIAYSFLVTNTGNVTLTTVTINDTLAAPAGPALTVNCPSTPLLPAAQTTCTGTYTVTQADLDNGGVSNSATASGKTPGGTLSTSPPSTATVPANRTGALTLVKSASPTAVTSAGDKVAYAFLVTNTTNVTLTNIAVTDTLAAPATPEILVACPTTTLAAGTSTTCTATYTAKQADIDSGSIANSATVSGTDPAGKKVTSAPSTALVNATPASTLSVVKTATPTTVSAVGDKVTYNFAVTNNGNVTVSGLTINDAFTAPASPALVVTCPTAIVAPKATVNCTGTYVVTQADLDKGSIKNTATAQASTPAGAPVTSPPSSVTVGTSATAKLTVTKTASPTTATKVGDQITYTFTVTNTGATTVSGIAIVDTFAAPAGPGSPILCNDTTLAPGKSTACFSTYAATQPDVDKGAIRNTAYATGTDPSGATVNSSNSSATVTIASAPALTVTKSAAPTSVTKAGDQVAYSFKVTNTGNVTLTAIAIDDTFTAPAGPALNVVCPQPALAPAATETCTANYTATQADVDAGTISNSAYATGATPTGGTVLSPTSTATVTAAASGALTLVKSASPTTVTTLGQTVTYTFLVTNTGNVTVNGVAITDALTAPAGPALKVLPATASVAPGGTATFTATYKVTQGDLDNGSIDNTASAAGTDPNGRPVDSADSTATVGVTQSPSLTLVKSASPQTVSAAGQTVKYSFLVTNNGNTTVTGLTVIDTLTAPAGPALSVSCPLTTLAPKGSTTCTATYTVTQDDVNAGGIANTATATGTDAGGTPVTSPPSSVTVTAAPAPALTLVKTASPATLDPTAGSTITYSFVVTNTGNVTISGLAVADTLAAPATPEVTPTCPVTSLDPGKSTTCTATYTVKQVDIDAGSVSNSAVVTGTAPNSGPNTPPVTSPPSTATVGITQTTGLTLVKTADPTTVTAAGQVVNYTFAITNTGDVTVTGLSIADTFTAPAGPALTLTCPKTPLPPAATTNCTASYTVTQADIDKGSVKNTATASATGPQGAVTSAPSTATVTVNAPPSLTVVKSASPTTVTAAGQSVTYSFLVTNTSAVTITGLAIKDPMLTGASAPTCTSTTLAPAASTTCTATYTVTQADVDAGTIVNTATATGATPGGTAVTSPPSTATVTATPAPGLTVTKTATPGTVTKPGDTVTYTVVVSNTGNVTITGITVDDVLTAPAGPAVTLTCTGGGTGTIVSLAPGKSSTCTGTYTATKADFDGGTGITNTATASGTPPNSTTPVTSPPSSVTVKDPAAPALTIVKTATAHDLNGDRVIDLKDTITYTFVVTNTGNVTITGVSVDDPLAGPVTCVATTLAAGASTTCKADTDYVVTQADVDAGKVLNTATSSGTPVTGGGPVTSPPSNTTTTDTGAKPGLTLVKKGTLVDSNDDGRTDAGDQVIWTFLVTNTGNVTITGLTVTDAAAGSITCPVTTLLPGASTTCKADKPLTLRQADLDNGSVTNTATVGGSDPTGTSVTSPPSTATVPLPSSPGLSLVKSAKVTDTNGNGVTDTGDSVVWTFLVTNTGNVTINDIRVIDPKAGTVTCPRTSLEPGQNMTCTSASHTITAAENASGKLSNTATVTGTPSGTGGLTVTSPPSTATVTTHGSSGITSPGGNGGNGGNGGTPVAYTGAKDLPLLLGISLVSLLLGVLLTMAGLRRRRQDGLI